MQILIPTPPRPIWISLAAAILLTGCAGSKDTILPQDGPTMKQVYDHHFERQAYRPEDARALMTEGGRPLQPAGGDLAGYTRDAAHEIQSIFPTLPNPTLVMYVFPHLTESGYPVPGYATAFGLYERNEYALPGEAAGW